MPPPLPSWISAFPWLLIKNICGVSDTYLSMGIFLVCIGEIEYFEMNLNVYIAVV